MSQGPVTNYRSRALTLDTPGIYRIEIQGRLNPRWITDMCDVTVDHGTGEEGEVVTTITGELVDQAALMGILNMSYNFGYPLLSLCYLGAAQLEANDC